MPSVAITLIEGGPRLLPSYAPEVGEYAQKVLQGTLGVRLLLQHQVTAVDELTLACKSTNGGNNETPRVVQHGFVLWASGVGQVPFVRKLIKERLEAASREGWMPAVPLRALPVDECLKVWGIPDVFALGDCAQIFPRSLAAAADELWTRPGCCDASLAWLRGEVPRLARRFPQLNPLKFDLSKEAAGNVLTKDQFKALLERIDTAYRSPVPTAQNARQAGVYLAKAFNNGMGAETPAFCEEWKGSLAYVGNHNAIAQLPGYIVKGGWLSLPLWKAVYVQMQLTWRIRLICCFDWLKTFFAGRDVGREHSYYK
ncbi:pyridine nucleotide-disulfide [Cyclospora cayetanensis]|nr:pyridine nucleotide-disulfide [Cyclospora cayetanensis]